MSPLHTISAQLRTAWQARPQWLGGAGELVQSYQPHYAGPKRAYLQPSLDTGVMYLVAMLLLFGLVMVYSASIGMPESTLFAKFTPTHFLIRQAAYIAVSVGMAWVAFQIPLAQWQKYSPHIFVLAIVLLLIVLTPLGKASNNARRWIPFFSFSLQPSELMKLAVILFTASYCVRKQHLITHFKQGMLPMLVAIVAVSGLLLAEPDLGALVVVAVVCIGVMFVGGSAVIPLVLMATGVVIAATVVIMTSRRARRVLAFLDPFSPEFVKTEGFQLGNSLIALARGQLSGKGLGNSVEKLNHLSEAHTDFILAIIGEEFGFVGVFIVMLIFTVLIFKAFAIGRAALKDGDRFGGLMAHGIGFWLALQAGIHLCVNAGAMPTKGLTLPFISYGGSALMMSVVAMALLLRVDYETRLRLRGQTPK